MEPIETPESDRVMTGPEGSGILPLPAHVFDGETRTTWKLNDEERAQIAEGGLIALGVVAHPTPPVGLAVEPPFCEDGLRRMVWDPTLRTYTCPEEEEEGDPPTP